ncbi:MAG: GH63 [uncultured Thermomicrobiales bacterium]|uniref:GH63 n=1 Tax=uncultured Thermomicrobiales bacterium TaxID=1645740 RepID=A0A6J4UKM2_9BACT|nr:MAG: GH63 [uncultured Thermomicrobiales bacterium]
MTAERDRLRADHAAWSRWGPYLSERAWGTVREDYSADGEAWFSLPHDHARSRAYRWNEDGLAGLSDDKGRVCFALALWNGRDPILKERLFGLTGPEGNHGEDVKEYYAYLDSTPTHSFMRTLYRYPHAAFPYEWLLAESRRRGKDDGEFELIDTGIFEGGRFCDLFVEYAKATPDDILIRVRAINRGPEPADLWLLPTLWYRNTWSWEAGCGRGELAATTLRGVAGDAVPAIAGAHPTLGEQILLCEGADELLFTENDTNLRRLYGAANPTPFVKDAFHRYVIEGEGAAINPARRGTKAAALYRRRIAPGETLTLRLRLVAAPGQAVIGDRAADAAPDAALLSSDWPTIAARLGGAPSPGPFTDFDAVFAAREREADEFYAALLPPDAGDDRRLIHRQALAGMLWSKQFYHYIVARWLDGDPAQPPPPSERCQGRNQHWRHLYNERVMSMPDAWEYPWFASWDLAFHCIPLAIVDPTFAKGQLDLLLREWYQHPNGQVPAYEWAFDDVNPPVLAWAAWRVYQIERAHHGVTDRAFLERVFHKLLINFTWWVNRKDAEGNNLFEGGFLGLDNIGVFDRSKPLPTGGYLEQSDGTSWMAMFCLNLLTIALELARENPVYESIATKFFEHFLGIAAAMAAMGDRTGAEGIALWDEEDEFFYDVLRLPDGRAIPLRVRSFVGLIPLFAVETIEPETLDALPEFRRALEWYLENRPELARLVSRWEEPGLRARRLLAICRGHRLKTLLRRALDPNEFLSPYGVRALSRHHAEHPYSLTYGGEEHVVRYEPAESRSGLFGGNSNWRGPIWFPVNYLLIESLQQFHHYFGDDFTVECPTGSGRYMTLEGVADELSQRLIRLFTLDEGGRRAVFGGDERFVGDPLWRDYPPFSEYFHGDTGQGLGASHQTGWTGLVAKLIQQQYYHQRGGHDAVRE